MMHPKLHRVTSGTLLALCTLLLTSCGLSQRVSNGASSVADAVFYRKIETLHLTLSSRSALNSDAAGTALPTVVWIYQLKDRKTVDTARYSTLLKQDETVLAADLLDKQVVQVMPANDVTLAVPLHADAQFVAIVALFMAPDRQNNTWRIVIARNDLHPDKDRVIELNDNRLQLRERQ